MSMDIHTPRTILPEIATGYQLDPARGFFSAVLPLGVDKRNEVKNPSAGIDGTGYVPVGGTIARDTTVQKWGIASIKVIPTAGVNDGVYYDDTLSLTAGIQYWGSVWFKGPRGFQYRIEFRATDGTTILGQRVIFTATGFWQRVAANYLETATTTRRVYVFKLGTSLSGTRPFWIDGLQVERDQLTTYIDGDQQGFVRNRQDYYWTGAPHASASVRIGQSRAGGSQVTFDTLGFRLLSIIGLGFGGVINQFQPLARGGAYYGGTVIGDRQFSLVGQIDGNGLYELQRARQAFVDLFKPDVVAPAQPMVLKYQPADDCGDPLGPEQDIVCVSEGDPMLGRTDNLNSERLALTFRLFLPFVMQEAGNAGAVLDYSDTLSSNYLAVRTAGDWNNTGIFNGAVRAVLYDRPSNRVIFGGDFTTVDGVTVNHIAYLDGTGFHPFGFGPGVTGGNVYALAASTNGWVWATGSFTTVNGNASRGLVLFGAGFETYFPNSVTTFSAIKAIAMASNGDLYLGGDFTGYAGNADNDYIMRYDLGAGTFNPLGTGLDDVVDALAVATDGTTIYLAGLFVYGDGVLLSGVGSWTPNVFNALGAGVVSGVIETLAIDRSGNLLAGGLFDISGDSTVDNVADWNGNAWTKIGTNLPVGFAPHAFAVADDGTLYLAGTRFLGGFSTVFGYVLAGSIWQPLDAGLPSNPDGKAIAITPSGTLYVGYLTGAALTASGVTAITNAGSTTAGPIITFTGPGTLEQISNLTTGKHIYFNLSLQDGEIAVLDLSDPSGITFTSSLRGNVLFGIAPGSQAADFSLAPGTNVLTLLIDGVAPFVPTGTTAASMTWRNTYHSIDGAVQGRLLP